MPSHIVPWIAEAQSLISTQEKPGSSNNPKILAWARVIGGPVEDAYTADSIPWCGLFVAYCVVQAGLSPVKDPLWALNWAKWEEKLSTPVFGCVISMTRDGGGHVGFLVSQDKTHWHVLGGNQSDEVNITRIPKTRKCNFNYPKGYDSYKKPVPYKTFDGNISHTLKFD